MREIKLGVIGMSEGNGHPYSWSAIFNGYDQAVMATCPFPVISNYLSKQKFPEDCIDGAVVTHVWAQDKKKADHIAKASLINNAVDNFEDMIGDVDGILLARDDPENHYEMSRPFLDAGLPVYIDKPLATDLSTLEKIYSHEKYEGQIFSSSALRYAKELQLTKEDREKIGKINHVNAVVPKSWSKYGVHIIDPVLQMLGLYGEDCQVISASKPDNGKVVVTRWGDLTVSFSALGKASAPIAIDVYGDKGFKNLIFKDTFSAFKQSLAYFVEGIVEKKVMTTKRELKTVVNILEQGLKGK